MSVIEHPGGFKPMPILRTLPSKMHMRKSKSKDERKLPNNPKTVLTNFVQSIDMESYKGLVCALKECEINDCELKKLLSDTREIISLMDQNVHHFVEVLLALKWYNRGNEVVREYQGFLIDLLSAHNYYMASALENLVRIFKAVADEILWTNGEPSPAEELSFENVHFVLKALLKIVPMSCSILMKAISNNFPYFKRSAHIHEVYIYNILKLIQYQPELRLDILLLTINKLVVLDVNAPKRMIEEFEDERKNQMDLDTTEQGLFTMDESVENEFTKEVKMEHPIANTLDIVLTHIFKYIDMVCHDNKIPDNLDWNQTKSLYQELLVVFERVIFPTHDAHHIQFIMFYLCSFNVRLTESFINFLWRKVSSPNEAPIVRQTAVVYIASFLARATFVPNIILKDTISLTSQWIHNYISNQDGLESATSDIRVHAVFFSVCQALFYVIAFRHRDLVSSKKNLTFLQNLNVTKIVTCRLNPLRVCIPPIIQNFAAVTRTYQLAYCYTIIEHNARNTIPVIHQDSKGTSLLMNNEFLETFFPFDPYLLIRSGYAISPIYREYQAAVSVEDDTLAKPTEETFKREEDDDFLIDQMSNSLGNPDIFSYGSSPGFKHA